MNIYDQLANKINELRRKNKNIITNSFFTMQQLQYMIQSYKAIVRISDDAIAILIEEEQFIRLYFYVSSFDSLSQVILMITPYVNKVIIADVIGKNPQAEKLAYELENLGFSKHNELIRMNRSPQKITDIDVSNVIIATPDKCDEIMNILYNEFDVYTSHLPNREKLFKSINNKEIIIVEQQEKIIGLAYFEKLGERLNYLYQIVVDKKFRGQGVADNLLMYKFLHSPKDLVCQLWVEVNNQYAINKYLKYNFAPDGLFDYIMIYRGD